MTQISSISSALTVFRVLPQLCQSISTHANNIYLHRTGGANHVVSRLFLTWLKHEVRVELGRSGSTLPSGQVD